MPKVRVVFDAREVSADARYSGIGTFVRELLPALAECDGIEVVALATPDLVLPPGVGRVTIQRFTRERRRATIEHVSRVWMDIVRARADVFHNPVFHAPIHFQRRWVQSLHDVIPLVRHDGDLAVLRQRWKRFGSRYRRADRIVAVSRYTADEGIRELGLDPRKVEVIHHGVARSFMPDPRAEPADPPYVVMVSEFSLRKGFGEAFAVIGALAEAGYPHRLKIAGRVIPTVRAELEHLVATAPRPDRIDLLGYVDDLPALVRGATVAIVTSRYEGFGLPAAEAMACGTPLVSFANSSLVEVVGDGGILVTDGDVQEMTAAVRRLLDDDAMRSEFRERGLAKAAMYRWDRAAAAYADVYRDIAR
jgi:glycosyltransferase involved in cell wall biosynthesis